MAFQQNRDSEAFGESTRGRDSVVAEWCESCELAGVGRQKSRRGPGCDKFGTLSEEGKSVRIDDNGYIGSQYRRQKPRGVVVGTHTGSDHPGLNPPGGLERLTRNHLREPGEHLGGAVPGIADQAGGRGHRGAGAEHARAGILLTSRNDAHHTLRVLVVLRAWNRPQRTDLGRIERTERRFADAQSDIHEFDTTTQRSREYVHRIERTECDRHISGHRRAVHCAGVRVDAARKIDRHDRCIHLADELGRVRPKTASPGNPDDAVDHQIRRPDFGSDSATDLQESVEARPMSARRIEQHGPNTHTSFAEQRTRPQGITAVVAGTDQKRHRPMRDRSCTGT